MIVLLDTSIWSLAFRRKTSDLAAGQQEQMRTLEELLAQGRARLLGPIRQELLSGLRSWQQFVRLREKLRPFPDVELETEDYEDAAQISNTCRRHGITGGPVDFLLCSVALRRGWAIYTSDRDFERYAKHIPVLLYS